MVVGVGGAHLPECRISLILAVGWSQMPHQQLFFFVWLGRSFLTLFLHDRWSVLIFSDTWLRPAGGWDQLGWTCISNKLPERKRGEERKVKECMQGLPNRVVEWYMYAYNNIIIGKHTLTYIHALSFCFSLSLSLSPTPSLSFTHLTAYLTMLVYQWIHERIQILSTEFQISVTMAIQCQSDTLQNKFKVVLFDAS